MGWFLRFSKWAARSARRAGKPRHGTLGTPPGQRRLGVEGLEARTLLSVVPLHVALVNDAVAHTQPVRATAATDMTACVFHANTLTVLGPHPSSNSLSPGKQVADKGPGSTLSAVADQLVVTTQPPASVAAGTPFTLVVTDENADGSVNTAFNDTVTVSDNGWGDLTGTATVSALDGVATFSGLTLTRASDYRSLYVSSGTEFVYTNQCQVTSLAASQLVFSYNPASPTTAGSSFGVAVSAEDAYGNVDPNFGGSVTVALASNPTGALLGGTLTVTAGGGQAFFPNLSISQVGQGYVLTATTAGLTAGMSSAFNIADALVITTQPPGSVAAGAPFGLVVAAEDGAGNIDPSFAGSVTVAVDSWADLTGTTTVTAVDGVATFSGLTLTHASFYRYLYASADGELAFTYGFRVTPLAASQLAFSYNPASPITAGSSFEVDVAAEDPYGNVDPDFSGSVTIALASNPTGAALGGQLTASASNGYADFPGLSINAPGQAYTLTSTTAGLTAGTSSAFDVADALVVTTQPPSSVTAGVPFGLVVTAEDGWGNVDPSFTGNVTVADDGWGDLQGTTTVTALNGVATFSGLTLTRASSYRFLSVLSGGEYASTSSFQVTPAAASQLVFLYNPVSPVTAGSSFEVEVVAEDPYGNVDTNFSGSVTIGLAGNPAGAALGGQITATASNGYADFPGLFINTPGQAYTLTAASAGLTAGTSSAFDVTDTLVITTQPPSSVTAGAPFGLVVTAEDGWGNVDPSFTGSVTVANSGWGALQGTTTVTAVDGVATFSALTLTYASDNQSLYVNAGGASTYSSDFQVTPAAASQLWFSYSPASPVTAGSSFEVTVAAEDPYGNVDTNFSGSVTLALANNPTGATLGGTLTAAVSNGYADFPDLSINQEGQGCTLTAGSPGLTAAMSDAFDVTDILVITTQPPSSVAVGAPFGLVVSAEDASGNVDPSFTGSVTVSSDWGDLN
jgi:FKBP-type peptidyl-prolyl cis-trans isomerase 2